MKKFNLESKFYEFDDQMSEDVSVDNRVKHVNAILTRGTPFADDSIYKPEDLAKVQRKDKKLINIIKAIEKKPDNPDFMKMKEKPKKRIKDITYALINRVLVASQQSGKKITNFKLHE